MAAVRSFIALDLPPTVKRALEDVAVRLSGTLDAVRWVKSENIHLTLKFLGDVQEDRFPDLQDAIDRVGTAFGPIQLGLDAVGAFPSPGRARVIWVGLSGDLLQLNRMHLEMDSAALECGFEPETRPFRPHLTLGRSRSATVSLPDVDQMVSPILFEAARLRLIRSDLGRRGARYTDLHSVVLKRRRTI